MAAPTKTTSTRPIPTSLGDLLVPAWTGARPYTVLVAPGGEIVFRRQRQFDFAILQTKVLNFLGTTYQPRH